MDFITKESLKHAGLPVPENRLLRNLAFRVLKINKINKLYRDHLSGMEGLEFIDKLLQSLNIRYQISPEELKNIPSQGPFIVISNHPFGFVDGLIMIHILASHNPDFKVLANFFLKGFYPIKDYFLDLNPFETRSHSNVKGLRQAMHHLAQGLPLGIFPSGEVSTVQGLWGKVEDKTWDPAIVRFITKTGVPVVPIFFKGKNSRGFHIKGKIHPYLRTLSIPAEFFKKKNHSIKVRIGIPIDGKDLQSFDSVQKAGNYMRFCVYALNVGGTELRKFFRFGFRSIKKPDQIIDPLPVDQIEEEVKKLHKEGGLLLERSNLQVFLGEPGQIPGIIQELGRLREITFRQVGEGTNQSMDVDGFDFYYRHLFIWDKKEKGIVGAYRLGCGKEIIERFGIKGFYVNSLFDFEKEMISILSQTLELGRSFVVKAYQQKPLPLFLLWQGILLHLRKNTGYRYIMGPVSISNDFSVLSKEIIIAFIRKNHFNNQLAQYVKARKEFKVKTNMDDIEALLDKHNNDLQKLDRFIANIEHGSMKIPVLLKQYIRQNAKIICFNVDPKFNNCLDGLMILDLNDLPEETMKFLKESEIKS